MKQAIRVFGVCLLLAGFVVAGCGGDDENSSAGGTAADAGAGEETGGSTDASEGSTDTAETPELEPSGETKAQYVKKANALCEKRRKQIQAELKKIVKGLPADGSEEAGLNKVVEEAFAPGLEAELDELRRLGAPKGDEQRVERIFTTIEGVIAEMREDPAAFARSSGTFKETEETSSAYGLNSCGRVL